MTMDLTKYSPTPYKISTITATGSVNTSIFLDSLFENIQLIDSDNIANDQSIGVVYAEYGSRKSETIHKGHSKKLSVAHRKTDKKKRFDNQVTIVYRFIDSNDKSVTVNSKVFKNGNIQMTGVRYIEQGIIVIDYIIEQLKRIYKIDKNIIGDIDQLENTNYRIRLINCDFRIGLEIKRDKLYKLILANYQVPCTYEPCIYPGVKIQYWWNSENELKNGSCYCREHCNGKGCGTGDGNCKKITIAVFQSGCIIITGGQSIAQIDESYEFICKCICDNLSEIYKVNMILPIEEVKKKIYIKKSTIRGCNL
jgi:TATA-box binding protein (TBP) (component of TFIID and TFIIIB)